ncbi:hypothetical protein ABW20_dc0106736 [Dactylellina cionopaga]|nr:hypothetical protein ABW20_dc0106736 [Dactylellina cionopaga]
MRSENVGEILKNVAIAAIIGQNPKKERNGTVKRKGKKPGTQDMKKVSNLRKSRNRLSKEIQAKKLKKTSQSVKKKTSRSAKKKTNRSVKKNSKEARTK